MRGRARQAPSPPEPPAREGGLRVVVAANSFAIAGPAAKAAGWNCHKRRLGSLRSPNGASPARAGRGRRAGMRGRARQAPSPPEPPAREGGLRVVVAANSFALAGPAAKAAGWNCHKPRLGSLRSPNGASPARAGRGRRAGMRGRARQAPVPPEPPAREGGLRVVVAANSFHSPLQARRHHGRRCRPSRPATKKPPRETGRAGASLVAHPDVRRRPRRAKRRTGTRPGGGPCRCAAGRFHAPRAPRGCAGRESRCGCRCCTAR